MVHSVIGHNPQAKDFIVKNLNDFISKFGNMSVEKIDGEESEYNHITESLQNLPFLTTKKLVILNRPGTQKQFVESLESLIESIPDSTDVIIVEPKPDKRSSYYKQLKSLTEFHEFKDLSPEDLPPWLVKQADMQGGKISLENARYLVGRVGASQTLLSSELDKLLTYSPEISRNSIDDLTESSPSSTIFNLIEAAFSGEPTKALKIYEEQRAQKVEPQQIIAMLTWQLRLIIAIKSAGNRTVQTIASDTGFSPYSINKSIKLAKSLSADRLRSLVGDLSDIDIELKSKSVDPDDALQSFLLTIS